MKRRTKIVCTLGPATASREQIAALIEAGMNVARINCSHGDWQTRRQWIDWIRDLSPGIAPVAILADLQGPKFRIGELPASRLEVENGQELTLGPEIGASIPLVQPEILGVLAAGDRILLGDGDVSLKVVGKAAANFTVKVTDGGTIKSKQGITVVGKVFRADCLTQKDLIDLDEALKAGVDFVALSYVHKASDMERLRELVNRVDPDVKLVAKIETRDAVKGIESIVVVSDVVMVARGDMGLQMEIEDVPVAQKRIIATCREQGKPVITATQMLESMMTNARPTRAEATDVANAILDGTDAVMLSGETAAGAHPIEAVRCMARIAEKAETVFDHGRVLQEYMEEYGSRVEHTQAVAFSVAQLAAQIRPRAIITTTTSGQTARLVSKFRPKTPILCATWK
ncbi:MAG TPA: pyruvate kinase, partial [Fimbriimonadaceae bacterium]|nr:pyruvate kinase [Fimbriimonadaceae bacterium]